MRTRVVALGACLLLSSAFPGSASADVVIGGARPVTIHVPPSYDPAVPMPLVIFLHGYGGSGPGYTSGFGFNAIADEEGFLFAAPDGVFDPCGNRFWNATDACCRSTGFCGSAGPNVDDSAYLLGLVEAARQELNVDARRIHFFGHSNGGFMSFRIACDHAAVVAAIASFAGAAFQDPALCSPASPVHVLQVHGAIDDVIFYQGGAIQGVRYPGAVGSVEQWAAFDGCDLAREDGGAIDLLSEIAGAETSVSRYSAGCRSGGSAELWTIAGGGHGYSSSPAFTRSMVRFLLSHPKAPVPEARFELRAAAPLEAVADASMSFTPDGTGILEYSWNLGDGAVADGPQLRHAYAEPGRYRITLSIETDDEGRRDQESQTFDAVCEPGDVAPWSLAEVGAVRFPGAARRSGGPEGGGLSICAGGGGASGGVGSTADEAFFVSQPFDGDFRVVVRIDALENAAIAKAGLMVRGSLDANAPMAALLIETSTGDPGGRLRFRFRDRAGLSAGSRTGDELAAPAGWLRLERRGAVFAGAFSADQESWISVGGEREIADLSGGVLAGFVAAARDRGEAGFRPLRVAIEGLEIAPLDPAPPVPLYRRGDANSDGRLDISDATRILGFLFLGDPLVLDCQKTADFNDDAAVDIADPSAILGHLFLGQPATHPEPSASCGPDPTEDPLSCDEYPCGP
jgi:polyhydroxybutyrate depolymerase